MSAKKEKDPDYWLLFAEAGIPHGIKGAFFLITTDRRSEAIDYGRVGLALPSSGTVADFTPIKSYRVLQSFTSGGRCVVALEGIASREAAEAVLGGRLYIPREDIRLEVGEFLVGDLVGTAASDDSGNCIGTIIAVHNFGAQVNLEVSLTLLQPGKRENTKTPHAEAAKSPKTFYFPFLEQFILKHDPVAKVIVLKNISDFLD